MNAGGIDILGRFEARPAVFPWREIGKLDIACLFTNLVRMLLLVLGHFCEQLGDRIIAAFFHLCGKVGVALHRLDFDYQCVHE